MVHIASFWSLIGRNWSAGIGVISTSPDPSELRQVIRPTPRRNDLAQLCLCLLPEIPCIAVEMMPMSASTTRCCSFELGKMFPN